MICARCKANKRIRRDYVERNEPDTYQFCSIINTDGKCKDFVKKEVAVTKAAITTNTNLGMGRQEEQMAKESVAERFLKVNEWDIQRKMQDRADAAAQAATPILLAKYAKELAAIEKLVKERDKIDDEIKKLRDGLKHTELSVPNYLNDKGRLGARASQKVFEEKFKAEIRDIKNDAILYGESPEIIAKLKALL